MKRNLKFLSATFLVATLLGAGFSGCQDYDDDIRSLQSQIDANKSSISEVQALVAQGKLVQMIEYFTEESQNGFAITFSDGTVKKLFTPANEQAAVIEIRNGYWYINGVNSNIPAVVENGKNGTDGVDGEDGKDGQNGEDGKDGQDGKDGEDGHSPYIQDGYWYFWDAEKGTYVKWDVAPAAAGMWVEVTDGAYILHAIDEKGQPIVLTLPKATQEVGSLTFVPDQLSEKLGEIIYFPVIATDYPTKTQEIQKDYEFDVLNFYQYQTLYPGYAHMTYLVNPNSANDYTVLGFTQKQVILTKAADALKFWTTVPAMGKLDVKATGFTFTKNGDLYDDPLGIAPQNNWNKAEFDMIALQVQNNANADTVTSDYVAAKRLVVKQRDVNLAINKKVVEDKDGQNMVVDALCPNEQILTKLPKLSKIDVNAYFTEAAVNLYVDFTAKTDLKPIITNFTKKLFTNMGDEMNGHYHLETVGFEDLTYKFTPINYMNAEVDQTDRYLILTDGVVSFDTQNTAAGYRQPVVRVDLFGKDNVLITSAFIKMQVVPVMQKPYPYPEEDKGDIMLECAPNAKKYFYDMDPVFNKCGMTKNDFVSNYDGDVKVYRWTGSGWIVVDPEEGAFEIQPMVFETATDGINYLKLTVNTCAKIAKYKAVFTYTAKNTSAPYSLITIPLLFEVKNYVPKLGLLDPNWENNGTLLKVNPSPYNSSLSDTECVFDYDMKDAFNFTNGEFTVTDIPCTAYVQDIYFVFSSTGTSVYKNGGVDAAWLKPVGDLNGKIQHLTLDKDVAASRDMIGKTVKIQAWGYLNGCESNKVMLKEFDAKFIIPLSMKNETPAKYLVDAQKNGSKFDMKNFNPVITDWRNIKVVDFALDAFGNKLDYVEIKDKDLYEHYGIELFGDEDFFEHIVFDLDAARCNLATVNGDVVIQDGVKNPLPDRFKVKFDDTDPSKIVFINTTEALQKDWKLYIPYKITHFWGEFKGYLEITVTKNPGTPSGAPTQR